MARNTTGGPFSHLQVVFMTCDNPVHSEVIQDLAWVTLHRATLSFMGSTTCLDIPRGWVVWPNGMKYEIPADVTVSASGWRACVELAKRKIGKENER